MKVTGRNEQTQPRSTRTALVLVAVLILFATVVLNSYRLPANAQEDTRAIVTIRVESTQPGELSVSWDPPTDQPHDYRISWARVGEDFLTWTDSLGNAFPTSPSYTITDLDEGVSYKVILRARYGGTSGPWTEPTEYVVAAAPAPTATATHTPLPEDTATPTATATHTPQPEDTATPTATATHTPQPEDPPTPTETATLTTTATPENSRAVVAISVGSFQPEALTVTWSAPNETPNDYRISWARVGEDFLTWTDNLGNAFPTSPSYTITGLDQGVRYKVKLRARYGGTSGPWTEPVEAVVASEPTPTSTPTPTVAAQAQEEIQEATPTATQTPTETATPTATTSDSQTSTGSITPSFDFVEDSIIVTWNPPAIGSVSHYILTRTQDNQGVVTTSTFRIDGTAMRYVDSDVDVGNTYDYVLTVHFNEPSENNHSNLLPNDPTATATSTPTSTPTSAPTESKSDRDVLVALYNATGGPNWTNNSNWLSNQPLSEWFGVTMDTTDRVEHLNLSSNNLRGTLPTGLDQLSNLKSLNLNNNRLRGGVPSELGSLTHLEDLDLSTNELTGTIPTQLGNLSNLETLYSFLE